MQHGVRIVAVQFDSQCYPGGCFLKIAVYHNLPSGGAKRSLYEMLRRLAGRHYIDVYTLSSAEHDFCDLRPYSQHYSVAPFRASPLLRRPFGRLNQLIYLSDLMRLDRIDRQLADQIDRAQYDVVFVHHCRYRQSPALLRFLKTPAVYYCQEPPRWIYDPVVPRPYLTAPFQRPWHVRIDPLPKLYRTTLKRRDKANAQGCKVIMVNSHHSQELAWRVYGIQPMVCYLGVDVETFRPVACQPEHMVLSVGALTAVKGHDLLIEGISRLPLQSRPPLVIISNQDDPRERRYLECLAEQAGVQLSIRSIIRDPSELSEWYSRCTVTGYTPILEPLGLVPLEAAACESPVVGVREGGIRETIVDGMTGLLVERDPEAVADALNDLLLHPDVRAEMGRRGRLQVQWHWTWDITIAQVERGLNTAAAMSL
jgi:glycosyltransferase involved in cell wall biosynthesis